MHTDTLSTFFAKGIQTPLAPSIAPQNKQGQDRNSVAPAAQGNWFFRTVSRHREPPFNVHLSLAFWRHAVILNDKATAADDFVNGKGSESFFRRKK
jgi:hypothetical protein